MSLNKFKPGSNMYDWVTHTHNHLRNRAGNIPALKEEPGGDNLGIALCTYFNSHPDQPEDDPIDDQVGWGDWVIEKTNDLIDRVIKTVLQVERGKGKSGVKTVGV